MSYTVFFLLLDSLLFSLGDRLLCGKRRRVTFCKQASMHGWMLPSSPRGPPAYIVGSSYFIPLCFPALVQNHHPVSDTHTHTVRCCLQLAILCRAHTAKQGKEALTRPTELHKLRRKLVEKTRLTAMVNLHSSFLSFLHLQKRNIDSFRRQPQRYRIFVFSRKFVFRKGKVPCVCLHVVCVW